jgi:integrase
VARQSMSLRTLELLPLETTTLDQWAAQCWEILSATLAKTTLRDYRGKYQRHIRPYLGDMTLLEIRRAHVAEWMRRLTAKGDNYPKAHLPVLKVLFREALAYWPEFEGNPTTGVKPGVHVPKQKLWVPWEEFDKFVFGGRDDQYDRFFRCMALHGLRWSEAAALTPQDIIETKTGRKFLWIGKTAYGRRVKAQRAGVQQDRSRKVPYMGYGPVEGKPWPVAYKAAYNRFVDGTTGYDGQKDSYLSPHSTRYTYTHFLAKRGIPPKVIQQFLGHETFEMTMNLYRQVRDDELDDAAAILQDQDVDGPTSFEERAAISRLQPVEKG